MAGKHQLYFEFNIVNPSRSTGEYSLRWELRNSINDKEGEELGEPEWLVNTVARKTGRIELAGTPPGKLIVAKVIFNASRRGWYFYKSVAEVNLSLLQNNLPASATYIRVNELTSFEGFDPDKPLYISFYTTDFPAASPPFSTAQARVSPTLQPDSTFTWLPDQSARFSKQGLYLIQQDTASAIGLAFRVEDDYPKLGKIETLVGPMIYVCEKKEMEKLRAAKGDKVLFDKTIISITGSTDRARIFMRNYFRRVEQANQLFSSYKEGWKTDRGMMYIVLGPPEEVYLLGDREVWEYKNENVKGRFIFTKASTVFDPENYVLIRDKKFTDTWYQVVDLWRKARF
ncbi:GWxTD domain-containing protein [Oscillatoria amoena NRMC-F 0135]|nr:GWxTD domain-containing protein [Oscillatoria amoena NRMC-F 0135]